MRVLVTSAPNQGHFYPMVRLLWALRTAGHEVRVAMPRTMAGLAAAAGLPAVAICEDLPLTEVRSPELNRVEPDASLDALVYHVASHYVPHTARTVTPIFELAQRWRPDVLVHTSWEYAGAIVAARLGIPVIRHGWGLNLPPEIDALAHRCLEPLYREWGMPGGPPDPWRWVDVCPASLQTARVPWVTLPMAFSPFNGAMVLPPWLPEPSARKRIGVTLGNVPIMGRHADVLDTVLEAMGEIDADVVVGASRALPPVVKPPANVRIEPCLPMSELLPSCDLLISHGGAGSVLTAMTFGLPQIMLPQTCVHFQHGDRFAEIGAAISLHPAEATAEAVLDAAIGLVDNPDTKFVAGRLRDENERRPSLETVVTEIENSLGLVAV